MTNRKEKFLLNSNIFIDYLKGLDYARNFIIQEINNICYCKVNEKEVFVPIGLKKKKEIEMEKLLTRIKKIPIERDKRLHDIAAKLSQKYTKLKDKPIDTLLASLAIQNNLTFVTRNRKDFEFIDELKKRIYVDIEEKVRWIS